MRDAGGEERRGPTRTATHLMIRPNVGGVGAAARVTRSALVRSANLPAAARAVKEGHSIGILPSQCDMLDCGVADPIHIHQGHNASFPSALAIGTERATALLPRRARCFFRIAHCT